MIEQIIKQQVREVVEEVMTEFLDKFPKSSQQKKFYTVKELSELLKFSAGKVREYYHTGKLPGYQVEGKIIFELSEVLKSMKEKQKAVEVEL